MARHGRSRCGGSGFAGAAGLALSGAGRGAAAGGNLRVTAYLIDRRGGLIDAEARLKAEQVPAVTVQRGGRSG